jgi:hypothetical protein
MQKSSSMGTALKPYVSKLFMHSWPELHGYRQLVCDFSCKDLTYPKDVVDSFSGVTTLLSDVFYGGFLYGLPEIFFGVALLWIISGPATRRNPKRQNCSKSSLPSWSWMGWQGSIGLRDWFSGGDYLNIRKHSPPYERFHTQLYVHDKASDFKREVSSFWRRYRDPVIWTTGLISLLAGHDITTIGLRRLKASSWCGLLTCSSRSTDYLLLWSTGLVLSPELAILIESPP